MYQSTKLITGFSTCFRQWRAKSHCSKLHGYDLEFKVTFQSENLDLNNWVVDFGFLKSKIRFNDKNHYYTFRDWFKSQFDHTTIIALNDPEIAVFRVLDESDVINLVELESVGCEKFAEFVYHFLNANLHHISQNPSLKITSVECIENKNNSAIFYL